MSALKIMIDERPRTPPPSNDRSFNNLGWGEFAMFPNGIVSADPVPVAL